MNNDKEKRLNVAKKVATVTIIWNIILSAIKVIVGFIGHSSAIVADGIHSLSDVFSTILAVIGVKISQKDDDEDHPYGHEKLEAVVGKILAIFLMATGVVIAWSSVDKILSGDLQEPSFYVVIAAIFSILVKEWMFRYTLKNAKAIKSTVLESDAWHHRSDVYSSIGTMVGVTGAALGYPILDPIASIVVSVLIVKVGLDIYLQSVKQLVDTAADEQTIDEIKNIINSVQGVESIDMLKTRVHGNRVYVDVEISVQGDLSLFKAHEISECVHDDLEEKIPEIKHCMVHVNPHVVK